MSESRIVFLDCTLRDGGYYNGWDFPIELINDYLRSVKSVGVDVVEIGLRSLRNEGFKGACAYSTDDFIRQLNIPAGLQIGVMVNAGELLKNGHLQLNILQGLFPQSADSSPLDLVRIACHVHEFVAALPAVAWLKERGFSVGFNLMQIADRKQKDVETIAAEAAKWPLDVLYFADSMGSMDSSQTARIVRWLQKRWAGPLGIHAHDNMERAQHNSLLALQEGVTWVDATVTGMGRGPGNAKTEHLAIEIAQLRGISCNLISLMSLIRRHFEPMKKAYGWGTNAYYYLAGLYGIHPTYIQETLGDSRYSEEDVIAVINHLRVEGGKQFSLHTLDAARHFYCGEPYGQWEPATVIEGRDVLLLGTGPGVEKHRAALQTYIHKTKPFVMALNTQAQIDGNLIDARVACHPVRLLADCDSHVRLPQSLIVPASMLPVDIKQALHSKDVWDFGLSVQADTFEFARSHCIVPSSLVIAYALAVATSGKARRILLAGFDGYGADDPRTAEILRVLTIYQQAKEKLELLAVTPTRYPVPTKSIYAM